MVITDSKGCAIAITPVTITEPAAIKFSGSSTNATCNGKSDGTITLKITGGTPNYQYSINGSSYIPFINPVTISNLTAGFYNIIVRDTNLCSIILPTIIIRQPNPLVLNASSTNVTCNGKNDGSITVFASGGTSPYKYSINGGLFVSGPRPFIYSNLSPGIYDIQVEDGKNCISILPTITITEPSIINITSTQSNVTCNGKNDGKIIVNASGGTSPFRFSINGGIFISGVNPFVFSNLSAGSYNIIVKDTNNCSATLPTVAISEPAVLNIQLSSSVDVTGCFGNTNGSITVTTNGGTAPYQYIINGGSPVSASSPYTFLNLAAGNYNIDVTDSKGCSSSLPVVKISQPSHVILSVSSKTDIIGCNGDSTGSISIAASGGTPGYQFSIDNSAFQAGNIFNNLKAGIHTIIAQDINNCPDTLNVTINQPAILAVSSTKVDPGCGGGNTGSISTNVTGGTAPFQYSVNGSIFSAGTGNFSNLPGGNYDIIIMDNGGCKVVLPTINLTSPAIISATINSTNPSTCNSTDGTITISSVSGGSGNYQFSLDGITYQLGNLFSGLTNGSYTIYIKDVTASCQITQTATLTSPGGIIASFTKQDVSCNAGNDGQITVSGVSGGSGTGYQYSKDGVTFQASNTFLGLNNGNYLITIKDNGSCITTLNITINQPATLQANIAASNPTDCTSGNGSITISGLSGGSGNYEFSLTGALYQAGPSFVNLSSGSYTIYIRDASNTTCQITKTQVLTAPNAINASLKTNNVSCNGANDGSINIINQIGGSGTYDYSIDGVTFQSPAIFTGLAPNGYIITVRDKSNPGCTITLNATISSPSALVITLVNSSPSGCSGSSSGSINVSVSGGVSPYQFSVNGSPFTKGTGSFAGLAANNYNITVQDTNLCKSILGTVTINSSPSLTATITPSGETTCASKDGKIVVSGETGPVGPYQYQINGNPNPAGINNNTFTGLTPGTYIINVIAANDCNYTQTVIVTTPCSSLCNITATAANVPVLCNGNTNGQAFLINVAGGSGVYEYNLNGGSYQATSNFTGLGVGNDTIGVRDKNNIPCVVKFPVSVTAKFNVSAIIIVNQPKTCNDKGTIKFTNVYGGTAPYTFSVDGTNFFTDSLFLNLNPGTYPATIKDANNCQLGTSIKIIGSTGILATVSQLSPVSCFGGNDGSLNISNVSGGSGTYVYSLDGSNFFGNTTFTNLNAGLYTVYVKDQSGTCVSSFPVTISQPVGISSKTNTVSPTTCNSKDGSIKVNVSSGGVLPYLFSLNGNAPQSDSTFSNLGSGNFIIVISDKNGCTDTLKTTLTSPGGLTGIAKVVDASCNGSKDGSIQITNVSGGSGTFEYSIDGVNYQISSLFSNLAGGAYVITIRDKGIPNPCIITYGITIKQPAAISATVVSTNPTSCISKDGKIDINNVANGISPYQYSLDSLINYQNAPSFTNLDNGNYKVYIKDVNGCITVYPKTIASPNAVSVSNPTIVSPTCKGSSDGQINLTNVSGGSTPYQYSIDGITYQSSGNFINLQGGNYTVSIKDNSGCIYPFKYTLIDPAGINFTISNLSPANCGTKTGKVQATNTTGGTAPYFYSIDGVTYQSNSTFNSLSAGAYKMYVRDNGGGACPSIQSFNVLGTPPVTYKVDSVNIGCKGGSLGKIIVSQLKGGIKPYQVSIDGGNTFGFVPNDSISFTNLSANNYQLVINYGNGCSTSPLSINITSGNLPITVDVTGANCGSSTGSANAVVIPSSPNYFYSLDSVKYTTSPVFLNLKPGPYIMYVREGQNDPCLKRKPFIIPGPDSLRFESKIVECNRVYFTNIVGGIKPYKISLDGGKTFVDKGASIFTNSYITLDLPDGDYTLQITDNVGCNTGIKKVKINTKLYANQIIINPSLSTDSSGSIAIMDIRGLNKPFSISLDSTNWKLIKGNKTHIDTIITHLTGTYNIYIRDANGCVKSYKNLDVKVREFMIPNVFTPNNDGVNDKFVMVFKDSYLPPANTSLDVYNRWGKLMYSSKNYQNDWTGDGHPDGVYYYFAKIPGQGDWEGWVQIWKGPTDNK